MDDHKNHSQSIMPQPKTSGTKHSPPPYPTKKMPLVDMLTLIDY